MGRRGPKGRLSDEQVIELRASGENAADLAEKLGYNKAAMRRILNGELYKHVPNARPKGGRMFTPDQIREIRAAGEAGDAPTAIAGRFGCSAGMISAVLRGTCYKDVK